MASQHPVRTYATCTHVTMVRVYSYVLRCDSCGNVGPFGWLYRCSQDREEMLRDSIFSGDEVTFDDVGKHLISTIQPRNRGPEKRAGNAASFLEEMPPRDITRTYSSDQLLTIFNQRKHLGNVLRKESIRKSASATQQPTLFPLEATLDEGSANPWVPNYKDECQYKICPYCRPGGADRAYISLDGIADGSIPATAVTGFGFHLFRQRPICSARVVANLGLRSPSTSTVSSMSVSPESLSRSSSEDITTRLATHLNSQLDLAHDKRSIALYSIPQAHLPRSPGSPNLAAQAGRRESLDANGKQINGEDTSGEEDAGNKNPHGEGATEMEEQEKEEGKFLAKPLKVHNGVAVLEESVEMHVPDLVTQV